MWPIWGRAAGQGMVFGLSVLKSWVFDFMGVCPKQGMVCTIVVVKYGLHSTFVKKSQIRP